MSITPLLNNILNQAEALRSVAAYQFGAGSTALQRGADIFRARKRILLSGMGASCFACVPFQHMLAKQGFDATCVETAELLYFRPPSLSTDTALVLVSRSGESIEVSRLLQGLQESGSPVIGIVNVPESSLGRQANQSIVLASPTDQLVAIQTYTATLGVFALLSAAIAGELEQARSELDRTIAILEAAIPKWVHERDQLRLFLEDGPLYLLSRGPGMGAVSEGVLLMHEVAKTPAIGMSVPQFRHGPVEVVDSHFRAIVIGTQPETVNLDSIFANDLAALGGQVRWLGPSVQGVIADPLCLWPEETPGRFLSIVETIPLQIAAYTKAEIRGIPPGDFRWAPAITNSETGFLGVRQEV